MLKKIDISVPNAQKRKIRGLTADQRKEVFNVVNYVPHNRVHANKRGPKNENLNKCLQLLEVRSWERGGDCVLQNKKLAELLKVSERQVIRYILQLEKQKFITALYHDNPAVNPETKQKRFRTFRIIRCHRVIAQKGYRSPNPKVDPNCRKNKPFRYDFRPSTDAMNFNNIPIKAMEFARFGAPKPKAAPANEFVSSWYEYFLAQGNPKDYDPAVKDKYLETKFKQEIGDPEGEALIGKHYYINKDIEAMEDREVMMYQQKAANTKRNSYRNERNAAIGPVVDEIKDDMANCFAAARRYANK